MDSTLRRVPRQSVVRAKNTAISCRERLQWKLELNQEFSADATMLSLRHENMGFSPLSVQFKGEISDVLPRKRRRKRHFEFCAACLLRN